MSAAKRFISLFRPAALIAGSSFGLTNFVMRLVKCVYYNATIDLLHANSTCVLSVVSWRWCFIHKPYRAHILANTAICHP